MPNGPDGSVSALCSTQPDPTDPAPAPEDTGCSPRVGQAVVEAQGLSVSPLQSRPSVERLDDWTKALSEQDDTLLAELVDSEPPGQALFMMETYINGLYRGCDRTVNSVRHGFPIQLVQEKEQEKGDDNEDNDGETADSEERDKRNASVEQEIEKVLEQAQKKGRRVAPYIDRIRDRLGWDVRESDLQLLRAIRRSSSLSPVLGAGVSAAEGCEAPSWPALVQKLLEVTLERGLELSVRRTEDIASLLPLSMSHTRHTLELAHLV